MLSGEGAIISQAAARGRCADAVLAEMRERAAAFKSDSQQKLDPELAERSRAERAAMIARGALLGLKDTEMARALSLNSSMVGIIGHRETPAKAPIAEAV